MDDFPAGPASPEPRRPRLSLVIPVKDGASHLRRCLQRLRETSGLDDELIVVDDGSADDSAEVAASFGATVLRLTETSGPAAARNAGALRAAAAIVFFLDADVAVHPDTVGLALARFDADPDLAALFGSYDDRPDAPGLVSRYRNLLHHFVHQQGTFVDDLRPVRTFWTGCGLIRKDIFLAHGGFDPTRYRRPAIEDIELGYRITRSGRSIVLARDVRATHLKRWSFLGMIRTDIFQRGVPWLLLMKRSKVDETDLNVDRSGRLSVAATGLGGIAALGSIVSPMAGVVAALCLVAIVGLNRRFYAFLARTKGIAFAVACVPLHLVYFACCGVSVLIAMALWHGGLKQAEARTVASTKGFRHDEPERSASARPKSATVRNRRSTRWPK